MSQFIPTYTTDACYKEFLPHASGRHMSDQELDVLISEAINQCPLLAKGKRSWLDDPRIQEALKLNAYIYGNDQRKYGGILALTHPIRTAHRAYNFGPKDSYPQYSLNAAFTALNHDTVEDALRHRTAEHDQVCVYLIMRCFSVSLDNEASVDNPAISFGDVKRDILALTDGIGLNLHQCIEQQILRVQSHDTFETNYSPRAMVIRFLEKFDTLEGDFHNCEAVSDDELMRRHFLFLAESKLPVIEAMTGPISEKEIAAYVGVISQIEEMAHSGALERTVNPALRHLRSTGLEI